jgi:hypothetical protein
MKFDPYTGSRYKARPVALVRPGLGTMTMWDDDHPQGDTVEGRGLLAAVAALGGCRVYCTTGVTALRHLLDARSWTAAVWKGRASSMTLDGTKVRIGNLRGVLDLSTDPWGDLTTFLDWVALRRVNPATIGTMATNLWRSTLDHPLEIDSDPVAIQPAFFGGRQQAVPGHYRHLAHHDISAAYPHSMAAGPYARRLRRYRVEPGFHSTEPGVARASVIVSPDLRWGPLPWRYPDMPEVVLYPTDGVLEGTWSLVELQAARELGCEVRVHEAWLPDGLCRPFDAWWDLMQEGRRLPGNAGLLAKTVANTLWGTFAMDGGQSEWKWSTKHGTDVPHPVSPEVVRRLPHARTRHLAVETTARVRMRLLREGLYGSPVPPLHVDTDGILIRGSVGPPSPAGDRPGQWRTKFTTQICEIVAPQTYRYTCGRGCNITHPKWHYVSAGRTAAEAREHWRTSVTVTMSIDGHGIPMNTAMERRLAAARIALSEADMVARDARFPDLSTEEMARA